MAKKPPSAELASNRRAFYDYEVLETFEAGIVLQGTEVKSSRHHGAQLQDAYILISQDNLPILKNAHIAAYKFGNLFNHAEKRERELLLHKKEIRKLKSFSEEKGLTLIPLSLYLKKGLIKVKIGVCRGKRKHDKRSVLKEKEHKREIERALKQQ